MYGRKKKCVSGPFWPKFNFLLGGRFGYKKASKKLKIILEPKSMDHKLSNDVFRMFIRFLVKIF